MHEKSYPNRAALALNHGGRNSTQKPVGSEEQASDFQAESIVVFLSVSLG